jgi:uncharacterized membrane protein YczE
MRETSPGTARRAPWHLWVVATIGLLWNAVGVVDHFMTQARRASYMGRLAPEQLEILYSLPTWLVGFWTLAVWGGAIGAALLLLRKRLAAPALLVSLLAMLATGIHNFLSASGLYRTGGTTPAFVVLIFLMALGLWLYAIAMSRRGVLT